MADTMQAQAMANLMGAIAHLFTGKPGRQPEFIDKVEVIIGGRGLDAFGLLQFTGRVRATGRPMIWVNAAAGNGCLPEFSLVADVGGRTIVIECCVPFLAPGAAAAMLVPDGFNMGAFSFGPDLRLRRRSSAPRPSIEAAHDGIVRAYERLAEIAVEQIETGKTFELPSHVRVSEAAR